MSVEDEIMTRVAKDMANEIDWELLTSVFIKDGWTEVVLTDYWRYNLVEVDRWCKDNCKSKVTGYKGRWLFKEAADATWFMLRWSK